jgi:hypothetical protein
MSKGFAALLLWIAVSFVAAGPQPCTRGVQFVALATVERVAVHVCDVFAAESI